MTKKEKRLVVRQVTGVVFNFLANQKKPDPALGKWTQAALRKDLKEIVEEISEDFGVQKSSVITICAYPEKDAFSMSTLYIHDDPKADEDLTAHMTWKEFMKWLLDSDPDELEWWESRFKSGAKQIRKHLTNNGW